MSGAAIIAELAEVDSLPGAEIQASARDRNVDAHTRHDALGVCRHVVGSFESVLIVRLVLRYKAVVDALHVGTHRRVPVLADAQGTARVLDKQVENADFGQVGQMADNLVGYEMEATTT